MKFGMLKNCVEMKVEREKEDSTNEKDIIDCK